MNRINPYSIIIGGGIGFMTLLALRNPLFALFVTMLSVVLLDVGFHLASKDQVKKKK